jgi:uncharacterized protein (TIGR03083 family)
MQGRTRLDHSAVIAVAEPLRRVGACLLELLGGLSEADWDRPTVHPQRDVKDLAAHLLHGSLRRVTGLRDRYHRPGPAIRSSEELVAFIQQDNRAFMDGMRRTSPGILIELIERYDRELLALFEAMDPQASGLGVVWAGEWSSPNWFDIAREYTEKWHHQQQIRDATGRPPLYAPDLLEPVLETFARGLPFAFRELAWPDGGCFSVEVTGEVSRAWTLRREAERWSLWSGPDATSSTRLSLPADVAWRLWTRSASPAEAAQRVCVEGDPSVKEPLLSFVAIMA